MARWCTATTVEILWSKESFSGNWMLGLDNLPEINTSDTCSDIPVYAVGCMDDNASNFNGDQQYKVMTNGVIYNVYMLHG